MTANPQGSPATDAGARDRIRARQLAMAEAMATLGAWQWCAEDDGFAWSDGARALHGAAAGEDPATFAAWLDTLHPSDRPRVRALAERCRTADVPVEFEVRVPRRDGRTIVVRHRAEVVPDTVSGAAVVAGVCRDVTAAGDEAARSGAIARAQRAMQRAIEVRDEVLSVVSHDLRGPLAVVAMAADAIERRVGAAVATQVGLLRRASDQMGRLIGDLLDVARLEAGGLRIERRPTSAAALVEDACATLGDRIRARGIEFDVRVPPAPLPLEADPDRVRQVLTNLLDNALKYTDRGRIGVSVTADDAAVRFAVQDTGAGISEEDQAHLFDRFWRSEEAPRREGAGLGLAIVRGLVDAHGGRVGVESVPGHGTTVWFTLPRLPAVASAPADGRDGAQGASAGTAAPAGSGASAGSAVPAGPAGPAGFGASADQRSSRR